MTGEFGIVGTSGARSVIVVGCGSGKAEATRFAGDGLRGCKKRVPIANRPPKKMGEREF